MVNECLFCKRENNSENPYCNECLHERLDQAKTIIGPVKNIRINGLIESIPVDKINLVNYNSLL